MTRHADHNARDPGDPAQDVTSGSRLGYAKLRPGWRVARETAEEFLGDECPRMAAAMSFYTVLSLPPLLVLLLSLAGAVLDPEQVRGFLEARLGEFIGPRAMEQVVEILRNAQAPGSGGPLATALGIGGVLFGATGAFAQLQTSLNRAWEIAPDPARGGVRVFVGKRATSFLMVLGIGALLAASVLLSTLVNVFGDWLVFLLPGGLSAVALRAINLGLSITVSALLFAAMFRVLPDAVIHWKDVAVGSLATALLFVLGKTVFGAYLAQSDPGSAFGAAGSLVVLLLWIYFSALVLLLGAEFTQVWARHHGTQIVPVPGAVCLRGDRQAAAPRRNWGEWRERVRTWRVRPGREPENYRDS